MTGSADHNGYGRCHGTGKVWVDSPKSERNFYSGGSCPDCAPERGATGGSADLVGRLEKAIALADAAGCGRLASFDKADAKRLLSRLSAAEANLLAAGKPIGWQDIRLVAGEGKLSLNTVLQAVNVIVECRAARSALTSPISREGEDISSVASRGGSRAAPVKSDSRRGLGCSTKPRCRKHFPDPNHTYCLLCDRPLKRVRR